MRRAFCLIISATLINALVYYQNFEAGQIPNPTRQAAIVQGTALAPYRYRVLTAALFEVVGGHSLMVDWLYTSLIFGACYVLLYLWLRPYTQHALAGVLFCAMCAPLFFRFYDYSPYAPMEMLLVLCALLLLRS